LPWVFVEWLEGRTQEQKRQLAQLIVDAVVKVDTKLKRENVVVVFRQVAKKDFARAGIFADEK
jgi:4-oxalocrotonate tautomerase family enzyme